MTYSCYRAPWYATAVLIYAARSALTPLRPSAKRLNVTKTNSGQYGAAVLRISFVSILSHLLALTRSTHPSAFVLRLTANNSIAGANQFIRPKFRENYFSSGV